MQNLDGEDRLWKDVSLYRVLPASRSIRHHRRVAARPLTRYWKWPTGRGMRLVELLSDGWGVSQTDQSGKTVWCEVLLPEAVR